MKAYLAQIDGWSGEAPVTLRLASHDDERLCHLGDATWWPAIATLPVLRLDFFDGAFEAGSITSPSGTMSAAIGAVPALPSLALHDCRIQIWQGVIGAPLSAFTALIDGRIKEQPSVADGVARLSMGVDDGWLDQPLLATYAGTGGAEGGIDLTGLAKPLALGAPRFAPAVLVDEVYNVYQLSAYGPVGGIDEAFDRLSRFSPAVGNAANFASLKAAELKAGQWATCTTAGMIRLGAPPDGMLCFHLRGDIDGGWSRRAGSLIARIARIAGKGDRVNSGDLAALDAACPWNLSLMVSQQTTPRELIQKIAMSVNAVAWVDWLGQMRVSPIAIGTPSMTMAADGSALPPVASVEQLSVAAPYWKLALTAERCWQVHSLTDIAFTGRLTPQGPFDPAVTYREGDMVTLPNGSQWLFTGTVPVAGSVPSDFSANWFRLSDAITAANVSFESGETVEYLKPAQPGADVTGDHTANDTKNVAGRPVAEVLDDLDLNGANWLTMASLEATRDALMLARTSLDGVPVGTVVANFKAEQTTINSATAETFSFLGSRAGDGTSFVLNLNTTKVSPTQSLGQYFSSVEATFGDVTGSITDLRTVMVLPSGIALAKAVFALGVGNKVVGMVTTNDGTIGAIDFVFDRARFLRPNGTVMWGYDETRDVIVMPAIEVDTIKARSVVTASIEANQVTGITSYGFADALVNGVVTIAEITDLVIGDGIDGRALVVINFTQDGTSNYDTAMRIITYVDVGTGYMVIRNHVQGIGVSSGNARWILPASFSIPILASGPVQFKVTAQPYSIPGAGTTSSSYARNIQIDIFEGFR